MGRAALAAGLPASHVAEQGALSGQRRNAFGAILAIILIVHLAVIVLWQVLVDAFQVPKFVLPSPLATVATLGSAKYAWLSNLR